LTSGGKLDKVLRNGLNASSENRSFSEFLKFADRKVNAFPHFLSLRSSLPTHGRSSSDQKLKNQKLADGACPLISYILSLYENVSQRRVACDHVWLYNDIHRGFLFLLLFAFVVSFLLPRLHKNTATMTTKKCISSRRKQILLQGKTHWLLSSCNIVTCVILLHSCCGIVEAVFAPADLDVLKAGWAECNSENGGTGDCVIFASKNDTSGTGTKNGLVRSWNVSRVTSMRQCECLLLIYAVVSLWKRKRKTLSFNLLFTNVSYNADGTFFFSPILQYLMVPVLLMEISRNGMFLV
jgi:hypothetical protein